MTHHEAKVLRSRMVAVGAMLLIWCLSSFAYSQPAYLKKIVTQELGADDDISPLDRLRLLRGWVENPAVLIAALKNKHSSVRRTAALAAGELKDPRVVEPFIAALKDILKK